MPDLKTMFIRQRKYIFLLLSVYVLGWGFTSYQSIFMGLIVGTSLSLFNLWLMVRKTDQFGEAAANGQRMRSLGMLSRMATAVLAVMISMKYPDEVHLISVVLGLMTSYIVIMIDYFLQLFVLRK
ncbi:MULTISPECIES: ATP synthase subunit I [Bacillus]|uniref:ATP synthase I n=1 Tax=Bacillus infantis NRRL B-14911 TaxID=1367477 RepID=U5LFE1_9BACI|nr:MULTISPECIES: ATP synthase subunit I [Bacillus]AGX06584.1 ATP synthase I [Bacillus infantis NRRL B-14911]EAR68476.1 AtpI [Bacillus sp. NRRL B-14911]MCA1033397.1 ATP synthase subunit I [Bacillus infantis]